MGHERCLGVKVCARVRSDECEVSMSESRKAESAQH